MPGFTLFCRFKPEERACQAPYPARFLVDEEYVCKLRGHGRAYACPALASIFCVKYLTAFSDGPPVSAVREMYIAHYKFYPYHIARDPGPGLT